MIHEPLGFDAAMLNTVVYERTTDTRLPITIIYRKTTRDILYKNFLSDRTGVIQINIWLQNGLT